MNKFSSRTLTILISLLLAAAIGILSIYLNSDWKHAAVIFVSVFVLASLLLYYVIEVYLRNRIKLVYKIIHQFKLSKGLKESIGDTLGDDPLAEMEIQVKDYITSNSRELENLRQLEQFRKEFIGNLSHELKTPLFNIQGYVHTLLDGALEDPKFARQFLERTSKSIERLSSLVDDLDTISKLEHGEVYLHQDSFDIHQLAKEVFYALELKAKSKQFSLLIKKETDRATWVYADKEKIQQVITNLLDNAIKYGRQGGQATAAFYDMDEHILVEITDNGIGIAETHLPRLFERFYRVDKHRSREEGGTGLGLAIVKHIIEAHRQTINVRSTIGVGTTFAFTLQKAKEK